MLSLSLNLQRQRLLLHIPLTPHRILLRRPPRKILQRPATTPVLLLLVVVQHWYAPCTIRASAVFLHMMALAL